MSFYDYEKSKEITTKDYPFAALVMAAIRKADTFNADFLKAAFPEIYDELTARYNAPGGKLEGE